MSRRSDFQLQVLACFRRKVVLLILVLGAMVVYWKKKRVAGGVVMNDSERGFLSRMYAEQAEDLRRLSDSYTSLAKWWGGIVSSIVAGEVWLLLQLQRGGNDEGFAVVVGVATGGLLTAVSISIITQLYSLFRVEMSTRYRQLQLERTFWSDANTGVPSWLEEVHAVDWILETIRRDGYRWPRVSVVSPNFSELVAVIKVLVVLVHVLPFVCFLSLVNVKVIVIVSAVSVIVEEIILIEWVVWQDKRMAKREIYQRLREMAQRLSRERETAEREMRIECQVRCA